jgi:hypothetical protein
MCGASDSKALTIARQLSASFGDSAEMRRLVVARSWLTPSQVPSGKAVEKQSLAAMIPSPCLMRPSL